LKKETKKGEEEIGKQKIKEKKSEEGLK